MDDIVYNSDRFHEGSKEKIMSVTNLQLKEKRLNRHYCRKIIEGLNAYMSSLRLNTLRKSLF